MDQNFGLTVDPRGLIQQLKNNLVDRYPRDSILKELLQNADDAGATRLELGWTPGLGAAAPHPLLAGPALFAANNGPFKPSDAEAIRSFGLNYKAADRSTIGKFGLGLKSVFHLCEAFFYAATGGPGRLLNPWYGTGLRDDWNDGVEAAVRAAWESLGDALAGGPWFLLWLPLRRAADGPSVFRKDYPGDDLTDDPVGCRDAVPALADQLPLLRRVERVRYWVREAAGWVPRHDVTLPVGSPRCRFDEADPAEAAGVGRVKAGPAGDRVYAIRERWVPALAALRENPAWPTSMSFETVEPAKDKALPHAAVTVGCGPAGGLGGLSAARAVFLPLRGDEERAAAGLAADYSVRLHGCFFVDAGRGRPVGRPAGSNLSPEDELRADWNERLLKDGACPLVLPALADLVREAAPADADVRGLTRALGELRFEGVGSVRDALLGGGQWLYRWAPADAGWRLLAAADEFLEVPDPGPAVQPGDVLPGLAAVAGRVTLTPRECPRVARADRVAAWSEAEVVEALGGGGPGPAFAAWGEAHWDYLARFLDGAAAGPAVAARVAGLLRRAFSTVAAHRLRGGEAAVRRVVGHVPAAARLSLPGLGALTEAERRDVFEYPLDLLVLPEGFDPDGAPSCGRLATRDAAELLALLAPVCQRDPHTRLPAAVVAVAADPAALRREPAFADLALWRAVVHRAGHDDRTAVLGYAALDAERVAGRLFRDGAAADSLRQLADALDGVAVHVVDARTANVLFPDLEVPPCEPRAVVRLLTSALPLAADPGRRAALLRSLLPGDRHPADPAGWRAAVRYLLHAQPSKAGADDRLLAGRPHGGDLWGRIAQAHLDRTGGGWQVLDPRLAGLIGADDRGRLGVVELNPDGVADLLGVEGAAGLYLDFADRRDRDVLLRHWYDRTELLQALPIHERVGGGLVRVGPGCFWQQRYPLAGPLADRVTLLRPSDDALLRPIQLRLAPELTPVHIVGLALDAGPADHWGVLATALRDAGNLPADLRDRLRQAPWLPGYRGPVAPEAVVVDADARVDEEVGRVLAAAPAAGLCGAAQLDRAVREHDGFPALRRLCAPSRGDALTRLAAAVAPAGEAFRVGMRLDSDAEVEDWLAALAGAGAGVSAVRDLVAAVWKADPDVCRERLLPGLMPATRVGDLSAERARAVLGFLTDQHRHGRAPRPAARAVHDRYLGHAAELPGWAADVLPHLRLLNHAGEWRPAAELCVATGLDPAATLDDRQAAVLDGRVPRQNPRPLVGPAAGAGPTLRGRPDAEWRVAAPKALREYFAPWAEASEEYAAWAGALLALLGDLPEVAVVAEKFLPQGHSAAAVRVAAGVGPRERTVAGRRYTETAADVMRRQRVLVEVTRPAATLKAVNLIGSTIPVAAATRMTDLFIGYGVHHLGPFDDGEPLEAHWLNLRFVPRERLVRGPREEVRGWVVATGERILREVYGQRGTSFPDALPGLTERDQEVRAAQEVALDAVHTLRQLGHLADADVRRVLERFDRAVDKKAEESTLFRDGERPDGWVGSAELERDAREALRRLVRTNADARADLLGAVRRKLAEYRYRPHAVLFELFQNADDATVELGTAAPGRFAVRAGGGGLTAMHEGRPVNRPGADNNREQAARDLRKMLALGHSDKGAGGAAVTGRFGLGFKSVYLLADRPRLLSGRLGVEILAGFYPEKLDPPAEADLRAALAAAGLSPEQGTAVGIDFRADVPPGEATGRFRELAAFLCAFARATHWCGWVGEGWSEEARWDAGADARLDPAGLAVVGRLTPFAGGRDITPTRALVLRAGDPGDTAALLLGLAAGGVARLADAVPTLWVTAPTEEAHALGYAVNGPFLLDVGRFQVTWNDPRNAAVFARLGAGFGAALVALFDAVAPDWPAARGRLGVGSADPHEFWASFWAVLSERRAGPDALHAMVWGADGCAARLYRERAALPTGVPLADHRLLTTVGAVAAVLAGDLAADADLLGRVAAWPSFAALESSTAVSAAVWDRLRELGGDWLPAVPRIDLAALVGRELDDDEHFDPDRATLLGAAVTRERADLRGPLEHRALFRSRAGTWAVAADLLVPGDRGDADFRDEARRAAFAPPGRVLDDRYAGAGLDFFLACRDHMVAPIGEMVEWAVAAATEGQRAAVRRYMAEGEQAYPFGQALRPRVPGSWLERTTQAQIDAVATDGFVAALMRSALGRSFPVTEGEADGVVVGDTPEVTPGAWDRLDQWWRDDSAKWLRLHDAESVPGRATMQAIQGDPDAETDDGRRAWLRLFVGGLLSTLGRVTVAQNRWFLDLCDTRSWFDALLDPHRGTADFLRAVERYVDDPAEYIPYFHWLRLFLPIAQVGRHLDAYVCSFRSIDRLAGDWSLHDVLAVRASSRFAGSGHDAPPLGPVLGVGACVVVRELRRAGVIRSARADRYCYPAVRRVRDVLGALGWACGGEYGDSPWEQSAAIHDFLRGRLPEDRATLGGAYDIPFLALAEYEQPRARVLGG